VSVADTFRLRRFRITRTADDCIGVTRIVDLQTGDELTGITSLEVFQTASTNPMFAVIKIVGVVDELDVEVQASVEGLA
jgi:hypothetical protein